MARKGTVWSFTVGAPLAAGIVEGDVGRRVQGRTGCVVIFVVIEALAIARVLVVLMRRVRKIASVRRE